MVYYEKFEGMVIAVRPHRESDSLVKIFTRDHGKRMFFIKQTKGSQHPLAASILPFTKATYLGKLSDNGLNFLKDSSNRHSYVAIHSNIELNAYATYILNLADAVIEDNIAAPQLYDRMIECMDAIEKGQQAQIVANIFEIQLLPLFGVAINWGACAICQRDKGPFVFSMKRSGVICEHHQQLEEHCLSVSPKAVHIAQILSRISSTQLRTIQLDHQTLQDVQTLMDELYEEHVGIHLKSKKFIQEMKKWDRLYEVKRKNDSTAQ